MKMQPIITKGRPYPFGVRRIENGIQISAVFSDPFHAGVILYTEDQGEIVKHTVPMNAEYFVGNIGCIRIEGINPDHTYYNFYEGDIVYQDPCAKGIAGREVFGSEAEGRTIMCTIPRDDYDWEGDGPICIPYEDSVFYQLHVRGFTKGKQSGVSGNKKGTFAGIVDKLPYLKELGVRNLELMPVYDFDEWDELKTPVAHGESNSTGTEYKINFWGYKEASYFAPKRAYSSIANPEIEFKTMVKVAHKEGIEIILQMYFPDSIKPGYILDVLRHWVMEYHVDGFHLMGNRIPLTLLATEPMLANTKLIYYGFPLEEIYLPKENPKFLNLGISTEQFQNAARRFLKGDENMLEEMMYQLTTLQGKSALLKNITQYSGFTLYDLVSYERKHNEENGEENRDGQPLNYSWNCGQEGDSRKLLIKKLRKLQLRNAMALCILSQGTPMLTAGDEDLNTQKGNNNPYCQDNEIGYKDWNHSKAAKEQLEFVRELLMLRRKYSVLRKGHIQISPDASGNGFPELSFHGKEAFKLDTASHLRHMGILYGGDFGDRKGNKGEDVYVAYNMHWQDQKLALPGAGKGYEWIKILDTAKENAFEEVKETQTVPEMSGRSIRMYVRRKK